MFVSPAGMVAFMNAKYCGSQTSSVNMMKVEHFKQYYIAIDMVDWNYAPSGQNLFDGGSLLKANRYIAHSLTAHLLDWGTVTKPFRRVGWGRGASCSNLNLYHITSRV